MGADRESTERATPGQTAGSCAPEPEPVLIAVVAASASEPLLPSLRALGRDPEAQGGAQTGIPVRIEIQMFGPEEIGELAGWPVGLMVVDGDSLGGPEIVLSLRALKDHARTPILLVASGEAGAVRRAACALGATEVLIRPLDPVELQMRAGALIALSQARHEAERVTRAMTRHVAEVVAESEAREREIIQRLMLAAEFRDDDAGDHLTRVAGCAIAIAEGLGLSEREANDIALASTMHDIGKIGIPDSILLKAGPLSAEERKEMQRHAERGHRMLQDSPSRLLQLASEIALTHHERWDGKGYPQGLAGTAIPLPGRIIAVADVFDALISERVYKAAWPLEKARGYLVEHRGSHFDPSCVDAFLSRWQDILDLVQDRPTSSRAA
ncbi:HD-GYP domain-containing protein [Methylobacterium planeticum]|uniref:HD domain-containing protein n=1 Tax=Methylobacterium planeticum TaxID=2615211 RepID=A0A6N6MNU6_9HYPH|nr:HD domain-containing phosphohydrolase [Methylobacterium planeticum]KAB1072114.1 HD domain-containing protein [Methylobacterium planeticum]